ncbi:MAG TPA: sortase [Thermoanaerobaculia bacterium]
MRGSILYGALRSALGALMLSRPIARIEFPRHGRRFMITCEADRGNWVISAPRRRFAVLHDIDIGDEVVVAMPSGEIVRYRVRSIRVVKQNNTAILQDFGDRRLTMMTGYPFDETGDLRYAVVAISK